MLNKFSTVEIVGKLDDGFPILSAEVFGTGIDVMLRAQGKLVERVAQ